MKQIAVLSGKGGTGKTTVTAALAERTFQTERLVLVDADVDAANLGMLLDPVPVEEHAFPGGAKAVIDPDVCARCGSCIDTCRFDAVRIRAGGAVQVDPIRCEGCGACLDACPGDAIRMETGIGGTWWRSDTRLGLLFHAELEPGEENSGRLVTEVRRAATRYARNEGIEVVLIDGPPGIGCPAIAACTGVDLAVVVTEPSLYGAHDLTRALDLLDHFGIPAHICVNRADLAPGRTQAIHELAAQRGLAPPIDIPYDTLVLEAIRAGRAPARTDEGPAAPALTSLTDRVVTVIRRRTPIAG